MLYPLPYNPGVLGSWDVALFRWINEAWASPFFDAVFRFFSLGIKVLALKIILLGVFAAFLAAGIRTRGAALQAMAAWPIANELADVFKHVLPTERPCNIMEGVRLITDYSGKVMFLDSSGTMSAHSANMAAIAMVLTLRLGKWGIPWIAVALLTGLSRIYSGVHFPSQVMLGWLAGAMVGWIVVKTWDAFVSLRASRPSSPEPTAGPSDR